MIFKTMYIPMGVPAWGKEEFLHILKNLLSGEIFFSPKFKKQLKDIICETLNVKYCLLTEFGRVALEIGLKALGLKPGDGIILPSFVCESVLLPILNLKCEPQFVDIGEDLNICPESVKKTIKRNTRAIIVPHLYGCPAPIKEILYIANQKGLYVIDDAAQSLGAKVDGQYTGTFGNFGVLSFGAFKFISGTKGGALITNDTYLFKKISEIKLISPSEIDAIDKLFKSLIKLKFRKNFYYILSKYQEYKKKKLRKKVQRSSNALKNKLKYIDISNIDSILIYYQFKKINSLIANRKFWAKLLAQKLSNHTHILIKNHYKRDNIFSKFVIKFPYEVTYKMLKYFRFHGIEVEKGYNPLHLKYKSTQLNFTEKIYP